MVAPPRVRGPSAGRGGRGHPAVLAPVGPFRRGHLPPAVPALRPGDPALRGAELPAGAADRWARGRGIPRGQGHPRPPRRPLAPDARGDRGPLAELPPAGRQPGGRPGRGLLPGRARRRAAPRWDGNRLGDPRSAAPRLLLRPQHAGAPAGHPLRGLAGPGLRHPRRRGRDLLRPRRDLAHRHRARPLGRPARQGGPPGGKHADAAAGQEPLPHPGEDADAQGPGGPPRPPARDALPQEEDPRGLPQRDLPGRRQRRLARRRRRRLARLLRQGRGAARPRRGGDDRRHDPLAGQLLADHPSGPRPGAARLGAGPPRQAGPGAPGPHRPGPPRAGRRGARAGRPPARSLLRRLGGPGGVAALRRRRPGGRRLRALLHPRLGRAEGGPGGGRRAGSRRSTAGARGGRSRRP